jgi:hypothetical protein
MNRVERRRAAKVLREAARDSEVLAQLRTLPIAAPPLLQLAYLAVLRHDGGPATEHEIELGNTIVGKLPADTTWFHGGVPGRAVGDFLVPGAAVGWTRGYRPGREFVYVTPTLKVAEGYAKRGGLVYRVEPVRPLGVDLVELRAAMLLRREIKAEGRDIDALTMHAFVCPRARVLEVIQ